MSVQAGVGGCTPGQDAGLTGGTIPPPQLQAWLGTPPSPHPEYKRVDYVAGGMPLTVKEEDCLVPLLARKSEEVWISQTIEPQTQTDVIQFAACQETT